MTMEERLDRLEKQNRSAARQTVKNVGLVGVGILIVSLGLLWYLQGREPDNAEVTHTRSPVRLFEEVTRMLATVVDKETADVATPRITELTLELRVLVQRLVDEGSGGSKKLTNQELDAIIADGAPERAQAMSSSYVRESRRVIRLLRREDHPLVAELDELERWMRRFVGKLRRQRE